MNVLIVSAHPDDEVLGCGGTISRMASEGHVVQIAIVGIRHLKQNATGAALDLGAHLNTWNSLFDHLDQRFDSVDFLDVVQWIEGVIKTTRPNLVYTHHTGDLNLDHAIVARAVLTATRPKPGSLIQEVRMFEVPSSTEWGFNYAFKPTVFVDISPTVDLKMKTMVKYYHSEMAPFPHPRSEEALRATATRWGATVGVAAAEAFESVRRIE